MPINYLSKGRSTLRYALLSLQAPYGDVGHLSIAGVGRFRVEKNKLTSITLWSKYTCDGLRKHLDENVEFDLLWYDGPTPYRSKGDTVEVFLHRLLTNVAVLD
jgi:hypothetical protein